MRSRTAQLSGFSLGITALSPQVTSRLERMKGVHWQTLTVDLCSAVEKVACVFHSLQRSMSFSGVSHCREHSSVIELALQFSISDMSVICEL